MAKQFFGLLTDEEALALANECPPHKIIIDGGGVLGLVGSACQLAYSPKVFEGMNEPGELHDAGVELAMAIHRSEQLIGAALKKTALLAAQYK